MEDEGIPENNNKRSNVFRCSELLVGGGHDESNNTLRKHTPCQGLLRAKPVTEESTCHGSGKIEDIGENGPSETLPKRSGVADDDAQPFGRVDAEGEAGKIVDEPDQADDELPVR